MTTMLSQLITDVRDRLDEGTAVRWSDTMLTRWINEGLRDIARRTETLLSSTLVAAVPGTQEYVMTDNLLRIYRVEYTRTGDTQTYPLEYRDFNNMDAVWWTQKTATQSTPMLYTLWGYPPVTRLVVYPTPSVAGDFKVYFYKLPNTLVGGTDVAQVPEGWQDLVVNYCEYIALRRDADPRWQEAKSLYEQSLDNMYDLTRRWSDQAGSVEVNTSFIPSWLYSME